VFAYAAVEFQLDLHLCHQSDDGRQIPDFLYESNAKPRNIAVV